MIGRSASTCAVIAWIVCAVAVAVLVKIPHASSAADEDKLIRRPAVAGMFYPSDPEELRKTVREALAQAKVEKPAEPIKAVMAPHAGYRFCADTMAAAFKSIQGDAFTFKRVVLIGPSHRMPTRAGAVSSADFWRTPLGDVPVDTAACRDLADQFQGIESDDRPHLREHSLEVLLPFLQVAAGNKPFGIVPIVISSSDPLDRKIAARALAKVGAEPETLVVVSTDLSHYPPAHIATKVDREILAAAAELDARKLAQTDKQILKAGHPGLACTMCGLDAVHCLLDAAKGLGIDRASVLRCTHSGMSGGGTDKVVGYGAMVFTGSGQGKTKQTFEPVTIELGTEAGEELFAAAREAVRTIVQGKSVSFRPARNEELNVKAGCFVTLKNKGRLRGCIGTFTSDDPLWKTVPEMAMAAARRDPRFRADPITLEEVPELDIEISVLSPMRRVTDPLRELQLGRDGILIRCRGKSGTFLPQVAVETGWTLEEFLGHCSRDKAGLGWESWKSPDAQVYGYTATVLHEPRNNADKAKRSVKP